MKLSKCIDCHKVKLLTKHSLVGGHAEGHGYIYLCRFCHDLRHNIIQKRDSRSKRGSGGKLAKGTRGKKK